MPEFKTKIVSADRREVLCDNEVIGSIVQAESGNWYLTGKGSDQIELVSTLSDGSVFEGGSLDAAFTSIVADYLFSGS